MPRASVNAGGSLRGGSSSEESDPLLNALWTARKTPLKEAGARAPRTAARGCRRKTKSKTRTPESAEAWRRGMIRRGAPVGGVEGAPPPADTDDGPGSEKANNSGHQSCLKERDYNAIRQRTPKQINIDN